MSEDTAKVDAGARPSSVLYQRPKKTKSSVLLADSLAGWSIRIGGTLVIFAVFTIMFFLIYVASPLLDDGKVEGVKSFTVGALRRSKFPVSILAVSQPRLLRERLGVMTSCSVSQTAPSAQATSTSIQRSSPTSSRPRGSHGSMIVTRPTGA